METKKESTDKTIRDLQRREQANHGLQQRSNTELAIFNRAISSPLIKASPLEEIKKTLRYAMMKVGLRSQNWPVDEEKELLHIHIVENFGGNRVEEIKLAFDMAIAGNLDIKPDDVKCYENFSCIYFSMIMNAYRAWASAQYKELEHPTEQRIFTQEELDDKARETAEWQYSMFLQQLALKNVEANKPILIKDGLLKKEERVIDFFIRKAEALQKHIYERL